MIRLLLDKDRVLRISVITAAAFLGGIIISTLVSSDFTNLMGQHLGGDFMAFYGAGKSVLQGQAVAAYNVHWFEEQLRGIGPAIDYYGLTWQYPPTYLFLVTPFALLPYKAAYLLWLGLGGGVLLAALRLLKVGRYGLVLAVCSPMVLTTAIQGQNSLLLGGLLIIAASQAGVRPILAGVAAGLLTLKPQLGVLIPIAFLAAGCWRAFFSAAIVSVFLAMTSVFAFGMESWASFADSLVRVGNDLEAGGALYPYARMISLYSTLSLAGVQHEVAMSVHWVFALGLAFVVFRVWRSEGDVLLPGGVLVAACLLVPPYAYYYEMTALLLPFAAILVMVRRQEDWQSGEALFFVIAWPALLLLPTVQPGLPLQIGFCVTVGTLFFLLRRLYGAEKLVSLLPRTVLKMAKGPKHQ